MLYNQVINIILKFDRTFGGKTVAAGARSAVRLIQPDIKNGTAVGVFLRCRIVCAAILAGIVSSPFTTE